MNRKKLVGLLSVLLIVLVVIAVVIGMKGNGNNGTSESETTGMQSEEQKNGIAVETKYGNFYVSDQWYDYFDYEISEEGNYTVDFLAKYEESTVHLFSIVFGNNIEDAVCLGELDNNGEKISVYVLVDEIEMPEELPEEKKSAFFGMQEEINSVIEQLNKMDNFVAAE